MKKTRIKIVSSALISAALRGLAVFLVFGTALYAYAAVSYPAQPNAVSGVVGLYVGKTPTKVDGNRGGYQVVDALCNNNVKEGAHVCTPMEMINTYVNGDSPGLVGNSLASETESLWLNSGAPAYYSSLSNDCMGWTENGYVAVTAESNGQPAFGSVWKTEAKYGAISTCSRSLKFACCK